MINTVGVLDYGSGNLHSVAKALERVGADVNVTARLEELAVCDGLVLPGVGAFGECMRQLGNVGGVDFIRGWVEKQRPLLGICVGHQVLFASGNELGVTTEGIGIYDGVVAQLQARTLPHMGWNTVDARASSTLFQGILKERFYFVHSYAAQQAVGGATYATHDGVRFVAAVEDGSVVSTQFHPEKSGDAGAQLLRNWLGSH